MRIKSVKLLNIRSYTSLTLEFPSGSVLLSGDIGAGKSSILHAIEFALFGIKASELPGSALLRHGKKEGYVELCFEIDSKEYTVKRTLKRMKQGVVQNTGYIISDGVQKDATPKELRALIFEILGYPRDLVSKNKDLIYRYTVYTPQEAMKDILYEKAEDRLDTLRKVFNMDKYKRIRENTIIILQALKEKRKTLEGFTSDLDEKKKEKQTLVTQLTSFRQKQESMKPQVDLAKKNLQEQLKGLAEKEQVLQQFEQKKREFGVLDAQLQSVLKQRTQQAEQIEHEQKSLVDLKKELEGKELGDDLSSQMASLQETIKAVEVKLRELYSQQQGHHARIQAQQETKEKISALSTCPTCSQEVGTDHKCTISDTADKTILSQKQALEQLTKEEKSQQELLDKTQKDMQTLQKRQQERQMLQLKMKSKEEKEQAIERLQQQQDVLKKDIGSINVKKMQLNEELKGLPEVEEAYKKLKELVDTLREQDRKVELEFISITKELEGVVKLAETIDKDIEKKEKALLELQKAASQQHWLSQFFMNLMSTIEKHVMVQINKEFNELFKNWFSILMEDELLSVRIDEEFTPLIEQNGYDTPIMNLSGGEKTSVALSYRLALNKVINDVVGEIKTKDLIMLDEPTDGFSTEQLDKIREVLDLLNISQVLVVSHEAKIESFVDHVLRVGKQDHVSGVYG